LSELDALYNRANLAYNELLALSHKPEILKHLQKEPTKRAVNSFKTPVNDFLLKANRLGITDLETLKSELDSFDSTVGIMLDDAYWDADQSPSDIIIAARSVMIEMGKIEEMIITSNSLKKNQRSISCPECGYNNHSGANFCSKCGYKITKINETQIF
jgi:hypothetical protein